MAQRGRYCRGTLVGATAGDLAGSFAFPRVDGHGLLCDPCPRPLPPTLWVGARGGANRASAPDQPPHGFAPASTLLQANHSTSAPAPQWSRSRQALATLRRTRGRISLPSA